MTNNAERFALDGKKGVFIIGGHQASTGSNATNFFSIYGGGSDLGTTEASLQFPMYSPFIIKRVYGRVYINTKSAATAISLRINGADVTGTTFSVASSTTGNLDSGELNVYVASGALICWKNDTSASASGNIAFRIHAECLTA